MSAQSQFDREEEFLSKQYKRGEISREQYLKELRELEWDYQQAAKESAQEAYNREMENW